MASSRRGSGTDGEPLRPWLAESQSVSGGERWLDLITERVIPPAAISRGRFLSSFGRVEIRAVAGSESELLYRVAEVHTSVPSVWWPGYVADPAAAEETASEDERLIREGVGAVFVAEASDLAGLVRVRDRGRGEAHIASLWVAERVRGSGVGTALLDAVAAWALERGCRELTSEVHVENRAMAALSRRYGFVPEWQTFAKQLR